MKINTTRCLAILYLAGTFLHASPHSLSGYVTNLVNEPVAYAILEHLQSHEFTTTDETGYFRLSKPVSAGDKLQVSRIGYSKKDLTINDNRTVHIRLEQIIIEMDSVSVEAKPLFPNITGNIYQSNFNVSSTNALANQIPALQLRSYGGLAGNRSLSLNGGPSTHTKVTLEGVDLTSPQNGGTDLSQIPTDLLNRITVSPLPGVFFGSGAIDGVFTLSPDLHKTSFQFSLGDYGFRSVHSGLTTSSGALTAHFDIGSTSDNGNYSYANGDSTLQRENNGFDQQWGSFHIRGPIGKHVILSAFSLFSAQNRGIAGPTNWLSNLATKKDTLQIHSVSLVTPIKTGFVKLQLSRRHSDEDYQNPDPAWPIESRHELTTDHAKLTFNTQPFSFIDIQALTEIKKEYIKSTDAGHHSRTLYSASARVNLNPFQNIQLTPAVRYDNVKDAYSEKTYDVRLSLNSWKGARLSAAIGTAFQYPGFNDLYWNGNPELKPEHSEYSTIQFRQNIQTFGHFSLSYTDRKSEDLIQWQPIDETGWVWQPFNIAKTRRTSITFTGEFQLPKIPIVIQSHFSVLDPIDESTQKTLLYTPDKIGFLAIRFDTDYFQTSLQAHYTGNRRYVVTEYDENWNAVVVDKIMKGAMTVSLATTYNLPVFNRRFAVNLTVENLLDEDVKSLPYYPEPGRTLKLGFTVNK